MCCVTEAWSILDKKTEGVEWVWPGVGSLWMKAYAEGAEWKPFFLRMGRGSAGAHVFLVGGDFAGFIGRLGLDGPWAWASERLKEWVLGGDDGLIESIIREFPANCGMMIVSREQAQAWLERAGVPSAELAGWLDLAA